MYKNLSTAGYDLYEIAEDNWALHVKNGAVYVGTFKKIATFMAAKLHFKLDEVDYAVKEMVKKNHNGAHFGMYRGFIFTFHREFKHVKDLQKVG